jgi:hypothetical protein
MVQAIRDRVVVSWHDETWLVTGPSFESVLDYVDARFDDPVILSRRDQGRRRPRVTLEVTTDRSRAATAPPLADLAEPAGGSSARDPLPPLPERDDVEPPTYSDLPADLEAIFASQNDPAHA